MDRRDQAGLGLAIAGHAALIALLSLTLLQPKTPPVVKPQPIDVSIVPDVALEAQAPQATEAPASGHAPEVGEPEDAAPPPPEPAPVPAPAPPKPQPAKPQPVKPAPAPPEPRPAPAPKPVPAPAKPKPEPKPAASPKPAPARDTPTKATAAPAREKPAKAEGKTATPTPAAKPRASRLGADFLKDLSATESKSTSPVPQAAKVDANALASIIAAITRQIQPCANNQVNPGPGANQISIKLNLRLNQDGTLNGAPTMVGSPAGVTDENSRYVQRVRDLGIAAFKGCSPLKLPAEYYQTANGGWSNINYTWKLR